MPTVFLNLSSFFSDFSDRISVCDREKKKKKWKREKKGGKRSRLERSLDVSWMVLCIFFCLNPRVEGAGPDGVNRWFRLWTKIRSLVCLSVLPLADVVPGGAGHGSCFELFGFDVMVDSRLKRHTFLRKSGKCAR